jgi:SsrA-binding protein
MSIVDNKKAYHDYFIEEKFEAGVALLGWEVKAVRAGRANIKEAYVVVKGGEIVLIGSHITPLISASTHVNADATRTRKLLLHKKEINRLVGQVERAGYTLVPLNLHFTKGRIKLDVGLAREEAIRQACDDQGTRVEPRAAATHAEPDRRRSRRATMVRPRPGQSAQAWRRGRDQRSRRGGSLRVAASSVAGNSGSV